VDAVTTRRAAVNGVELELIESGDPSAPPVILSHGFPESAYSWRHQMAPLAEAGYHALAPNQRGYGRSSRPERVEDYGILALTGDLLGLLDETGYEQGVFVGHDWGALIVWELARLFPERVRALYVASVPLPRWPARPTEAMRAAFGDRFFYMLYFQPVGPADDELGRDPRLTLAKTLYWASGDGFHVPSSLPPAEGTGFLDQMGDVPDDLPSWLSWDDVEHYAEQFRHSGFFGPLSYYRNLDANYDVVRAVPFERIAMPVGFVAGDRDVVIARNPGHVEAMQKALPDVRSVVLLPGIGHWTQQEAPEAFNAALLDFLASL
jgi:pimeloyl-ACP methyl ester carboxylesterase